MLYPPRKIKKRTKGELTNVTSAADRYLDRAVLDAAAKLNLLRSKKLDAGFEDTRTSVVVYVRLLRESDNRL